MPALGHDLRAAVRALRRGPGFAATAALVLALAIAANAVAFSFVNSVRLRPLPVSEPNRLVRVYTSYEAGPRFFSVPDADFLRLKDLDVFSAVMADEPAPIHLGDGSYTERLWAYHVTGNYFSVLGVSPALGRFFLPDETLVPSRQPVVVLSHDLWRRRFGGDVSAVGRSVAVNGRTAVVIGVAPAGFHGVNVGVRPQLWIPVRVEERGRRGYFVIGRLRDGVPPDAARAAVRALGERLRREQPSANEGKSLIALPESEGGVHPLVRGAFLDLSSMLATAMVLVLLLSCANVAGLLVARAAGRRREIAVRLAIGASPLHVVRQLLAESALLWLIAGSLGTALAALVVRLLAALPLPTDRPLFLDLEVDARVLAFSFAATALTGLAFGLVPALAVARADLVQALKDGAGRGVGFRSPLRLALLAGQVALSVVLLVGGSLCLRSLANAHSIDLGFEPDGVLMASLDLELQGYDERAARSFWSGLLERLAALPQVEAVGLSNRVPFQLNLIRLPVSAHGRDGRGLPSVDTAIVDAGYFDALRVPIRAGRGFGPLSDAPRATAEVVINENLARRLWPGEEALGRKLRVGGGLHEVVGVAKDGRYFTLGEEPTPFLYLRFARTPSAMTVLVRSSLGSARPSVIADLRRAVADLDKALPLFDAKSLHEHLGVALLPARVSAGVLGWFGALALLLVSVGLHGLLSHAVTLRTHEIGVRRALGARDADVVRLVVGQALLPVLAGVALGLGVAFALSPVLRALLYGIAPGDPAANALAAAALLFTAAVASSLPALRAARLEPMAALRRE